MTNDIAINGYGRIGPNVPCAFMKAGRVHDIEIVAINDLEMPKQTRVSCAMTPRMNAAQAQSR
jgi:glyceraldehyde-3-phosphate dehydrogenase/erythrose-4-phosphate dehydrogenase